MGYDDLEEFGSADIMDALTAEKRMSLLEGLKKYPAAVFWSMSIALTVVMDGYETALLGAFFGYPQFNEKYGDEFAPGQFTIPARWQTGLSMAGSVGTIIGIMFSGFMLERLGHRRILMTGLTFTIGCIFILFFAPTKAVLLVGELLLGIPIGVFSIMAPIYASEVCPVVLRGYLTTYISASWVIGHLISQAVLRGCLHLDNEWAYRIPFAVQWVWPPCLITLVYFAPESPWWLVRSGRIDEAINAVKRLSSDKSNSAAERTVEAMVQTNELEMKIQSGTTFWDCFKGVELRRTEICSITFICQTMCVGNVIWYSSFFFTTAGLNPVRAFDLSVGQYAIGIVGIIASWFLITKLGRRTIYVWGLFTIGVLFFIMGCISLAPHSNTAVPWAVAALLLVIVFVYDATVSPVCYSLICELSSTRLRGKTVSIASSLYSVWNIISAVVYPYALNPTAGNWQGKIGFLQAGLCALCFAWAFWRLPEPKGRTFVEIDIMFMNEVPARKFRSYSVDSFGIQSIESKRDTVTTTKEV